jgi:hypothetical protein
MEHPLESIRGKRVKVFFVEVDDEDRERVLECLVDNVSIRVDTDYSSILSDYSMAPLGRYVTSQNYVIEEMSLIPMNEEGHVMVMRDFSKEDEHEG